jgi:hypothetical protein
VQVSKLKFIDQVAVDKIECDWYYFQDTIMPVPAYRERLISFKVKDGYNYFLRKIHCNRPEYYRDERNAINGIPDIRIEFINKYRSRTHQNEKYPHNLITTPEADLSATFLQQMPIHGAVQLNLFYNQSETVELRVSESQSSPTDVWNGFFSVVFCGYHIPVNEGKGKSWFYGKN